MTIGDIANRIRRLTNTTSSSYSNDDLAIDINTLLDEIHSEIIRATKGADQQRGDMNYTSFPSFRINLTDGTTSYGLNDLSTRPLTIKGVEVLDQNGEEHIVYPTSFKKIRASGIELDNYAPTNGLPTEYLIWDNMIRLLPAPATANVTLANGLIIYYDRGPSTFTGAEIATGTKEPGFPVGYHNILIYGIVSEYWYSKESFGRGDRFNAKYERGLKKMLAFLNARDQDIRKRITVRRTYGDPYRPRFRIT